MRTTKSSIVRLVMSVIICQLAGVVGSLFTTPAIPTWYATLSKPPFTPPSWVFAPVWTGLFLLMGVALFLVWDRGLETNSVRLALKVFAVQLALNVVWSILFFGLRSPLAGLIDIVLLFTAILITIRRFWRVSRTAGILLVPYIVWVSFATVLNLSIFVLNR